MSTKRKDGKVLVQCHVERWVLEGLRREAAEDQRSVDQFLSRWLIESCEHYPENPKNKAASAPPEPVQRPFTPPPTQQPPAVFGSPSPPRARHQVDRPLSEMPDFEEIEDAESSR
jgi:hypothetical protein